MLKKTITYTDFNGNTRTEDFYFAINKADLIRQEMMTAEIDKDGNVTSETFIDKLKRISESENKKGSEVLPLFEDIIKMTVGVKSEDGRYFRKPAGYADDFLESAAWNELFIEFMENPGAAADFINGAVPKDISGQDSEEYKRELARARSEANMQGFKKKDSSTVKDLPSEETTELTGEPKATLETTDGLNNNPWPRRDAMPTEDAEGRPLFRESNLTDAERAELEELRRERRQLRSEETRPDEGFRPPHESGPGYQQ